MVTYRSARKTAALKLNLRDAASNISRTGAPAIPLPEAPITSTCWTPSGVISTPRSAWSNSVRDEHLALSAALQGVGRRLDRMTWALQIGTRGVVIDLRPFVCFLSYLRCFPVCSRSYPAIGHVLHSRSCTLRLAVRSGICRPWAAEKPQEPVETDSCGRIVELYSRFRTVFCRNRRGCSHRRRGCLP